MTVTLDIAPHIFDQVQAEARAQNRQPADLLREAIADRWDGHDGNNDALTELAIPAADVDALHESLAQAGRGDVHDGPLVMQEVFARALGRNRTTAKQGT